VHANISRKEGRGKAGIRQKESLSVYAKHNLKRKAEDKRYRHWNKVCLHTKHKLKRKAEVTQ
jgi:hypothetical protein